MSFRLPSVIVYQELLSTTINPSTPFMDLCVVGPVYQCQNETAMDNYEIHTLESYTKKFPELKSGAIIDGNSVYLTLSNINVKVWPTNNAKCNAVTLDNTGATSVIYDVTGMTGNESLSTANIQEGDEVDIIYTDTDGVKKVKTAKISAIKTENNKKKYYLQKNILAVKYPGVYPDPASTETQIPLMATVKRKISGNVFAYPENLVSYTSAEEQAQEAYIESLTDSSTIDTPKTKGFNLVYNSKTGEIEKMNINVGSLEVPVKYDSTTVDTESTSTKQVWPATLNTSGKVILDNSGPSSMICDVDELGLETGLDSVTLKEGDYVTISYTDTDNRTKTITEKIYSVLADATSRKKYYVLQKNILKDIEEYADTSIVYAIVNRTTEYIDNKTDSSTTQSTVVVDCNVKVTYKALRTDIANDFITISSYSEALAQFGSPDINNPMSIAAQVINSAMNGLTYKVLPISSDDFNGYNLALDVLSNSESVYVIEPLTTDKQVISTYVSHCKAMSEAEKSKWRIMYANMPMPATKVVVELNSGKLLTMGTETECPSEYTFTIADAATETDTGWTQDGENFKREFTLTSKFLSVYKGTTRIPETGMPYYSYNSTTNKLTVYSTEKFAGKVVTENKDFDYSSAVCYLKDLDSNVGGFISNIVRPTDFVDLYKQETGGKITYKYSLQVAKVESESAVQCYTQKWIRKTDGYYPVEGEYQHFSADYKDKGKIIDLENCGYEAVRVLDTQGMAEAIAGVAESYKSKRLRYVQPDQIMITVNSQDYLVGGEYLCVALGAMRAGFPPHQGFSTMGISGINRITRSNKMFSEDQLTYMASKGVFWVAQDAPEELPYVLYQTTTDNGQLEVAEDSIVAVVDYASKFYKNNLTNVLGRYNVNTISMNYVKTVINACSNEMTGTNYEYIGPMLTSATLLSLVAEGDKIKPTIKIGVPYPVNGVDITLQV